eukprot:scaffold64754_cov33-Tisochrysis_lutea.AAC.3
MSAVHGVAGATGRVARRGSRSPARPLTAGAAALTATAPWGQGGPRRGARRRGGERRRAPWQLTIKLVDVVQSQGASACACTTTPQQAIIISASVESPLSSHNATTRCTVLSPFAFDNTTITNTGHADVCESESTK